MRKIKLITSFISFFIFSFSLTYAQLNGTNHSKLDRLETAYNIIENSYPKTRYYNAGLSLAFGGLTTLREISVLNDDQVTNSEKIMAYSLIGIGSVRIADAFNGFFFSTSIEKNLVKFQGMKDSQ